MGYLWILQFRVPSKKRIPAKKNHNPFSQPIFVAWGKKSAPSCQSCMVAGLNPKANIPDLTQKTPNKKHVNNSVAELARNTFVVQNPPCVSEDVSLRSQLLGLCSKFCCWVLTRSSRLFMSCANG